MSQVRDTSDPPRAIIHKRILDVAESRPDASMAELADDVTGASTNMVEKVLEEYGDPGDDTATTAPNDESSPPDTDPGPPVATNAASGTPDENVETGDDCATEKDLDSDSPAGTDPSSDVDATMDTDPSELDLTDRQLNALRLIRERPDASQADLADALDVTRPTVSRWVNEIPGFDWSRRREIADRLLNGSSNTATMSSDTPTLTDLADRIDAIEADLAAESAATGTIDPVLLHKVMHACLHSDRITEDEELQLLRTFMGSNDS